MADIGQSKRAGQKDLPDPCAEKRELRRMVQEVERCRDLFEKRLRALDNPETLAGGLSEREKGFQAGLRFCLNHMNDILDGGGDQS
jgi:hypothetical protein